MKAEKSSVKRSKKMIALYEEQGGLCAYCPIKIDLDLKGGYMRPSFDHIIPLSKGGANIPENLLLTHQRCNYDKRDYLPQELINILKIMEASFIRKPGIYEKDIVPKGKESWTKSVFVPLKEYKKKPKKKTTKRFAGPTYEELQNGPAQKEAQRLWDIVCNES